jgi:hypothetical protein
MFTALRKGAEYVDTDVANRTMTVALRKVHAELWQSSVSIGDKHFCCGYWQSQAEAEIACQIYARIVQLREETV